MKSRRFKWFKMAIAVGFLLGGALLVESSLTYQYVTRHLVWDHLTWQAGQHLSLVENRARRLNIETKEQFRKLVEEICEERPGQIAWLRIVDAQGGNLAQTGNTYGRNISPGTLEALLKERVHSVSEIRSTPDGDVLVVALPLQYRLKTQQLKTSARPSKTGLSSFNVAEIAVVVHGPDDLFRALRSNLAISTGSALALLVSMAVVFGRLPSFLRGRELEDQLVLARTVQESCYPPSARHAINSISRRNAFPPIKLEETTMTFFQPTTAKSQ